MGLAAWAQPFNITLTDVERNFCFDTNPEHHPTVSNTANSSLEKYPKFMFLLRNATPIMSLMCAYSGEICILWGWTLKSCRALYSCL